MVCWPGVSDLDHSGDQLHIFFVRGHRVWIQSHQHWLICRLTVSPGLRMSYLESQRLGFSCLSCSLRSSSSSKGDSPAPAWSRLVNPPHSCSSFVQSDSVPWVIPEHYHCTDSILHLPNCLWGSGGTPQKRGRGEGPIRSHSKVVFLEETLIAFLASFSIKFR